MSTFLCEYRMKSFDIKHWRVYELWPRHFLFFFKEKKKRGRQSSEPKCERRASMRDAKKASQIRWEKLIVWKHFREWKKNSTCKSVVYPVDIIQPTLCQLNWWNRACVRVIWQSIACEMSLEMTTKQSVGVLLGTRPEHSLLQYNSKHQHEFFVRCLLFLLFGHFQNKNHAMD